MLPIVKVLASQGLNLLANAVMAKGQAVIEEKLGVKLDSAKPEELRRAEVEHEQFLLEISVRKIELDIEAEENAQNNVTSRWQADMLSDSWLSKNIRPVVLAFMTVNVFLLAYFSHWLQVDDAFVELIKVSYGIVLAAYFVGRSVEKYTDMKERGK